jgi:hypothetical protein
MVTGLLLFLYVLLVRGASINNNTCTFDTAGCSYIPGYVNTALLSQRDVAYNVSVDQLTTLGINMSSAVFSEYDYTTEALDVFKRVLGSGYRSIYLDLYWNEDLNEFQLCPGKVPNTGAPDSIKKVEGLYGSHYCQRNFSLDDILLQMSEYIKATDTDISVNVMLMRLYLYRLDDTKADGKVAQNISSKLISYLDNRIYTPVDLRNDRKNGFTFGVSGKSENGYPTAHRFLLELKQRIMVSVTYMNLDKDAYDISQDEDTVFEIDEDRSGPDYMNSDESNDAGMSYVTDKTPKMCHSNSTEYLSTINSTTVKTWRTILDTKDNPFTTENIRDYVQCGFSPVINTGLKTMQELVEPVDASIWAWSLEQPTWKHSNNKTNEEDGPVAWECAILDTDGWKVANCYAKYKSLCRANNMAYDWNIGEKEENYFEAINACEGQNYFSVPRTALQNKVAMIELNNSLPVWIDLNSISVDNCWVTGGPYASCPYHPVSNNRNEVVKLSIAAMVAFLLVVLILLLKLDKVPLKKHQYRWRRLVNKAAEEEYEGVPA